MKLAKDKDKKTEYKKYLFYAFHSALWIFVIFYNIYFTVVSDNSLGACAILLFVVLPISFLILLTDSIYLLVRFSGKRKEKRRRNRVMNSKRKVIRVDPLEEYRLLAEFDNGEQRIADIKPVIVSEKAFAPLKNTILFNRVYIKNGTATWLDLKGNEVYIIPDELYADSLPYKRS